MESYMMKLLMILLATCLLLTTLTLVAAEKPTDSKSPQKTKTTGWVDGKYVRLKTRQTKSGKVTTGYVNGKYVRLKEKKK